MNQRVLARKSADASLGRTAPSLVRQLVNSPGVPLSTEARSYFEPRFGFDFSRVRVHADSTAAAAARSMDAAAYAVGEHIGFDSGRYQMHSQRGRRLMAHELAHTVQQSGALPAGDLRMGSPADASEKEADRVSSAVLSHGRVGIHAQRPLSVQCQPNQPDLPDLDLAKNASPLLASAIGSMTLDKFETGKSDIPAAHKAELARTVKNITSLLRQYPGSTIHIVGHTDAIGIDADNETLGQSRADAVEQALVAMGVPAEAIQTESHGSSDLRVKTKMENAQNRRVEMRFQPARQFPGIMSQHLSLSGGPSQAPPDLSNLFPPKIPSMSPGFPQQPGPPYRRQSAPPDAFKALPSEIPYDLMDPKALSDAYTSHGNRPDMGGDLRETWAAAYRKYRYVWGLSKELAAKAANSELSGTASSDQSRDYPNAQDRFNQEWKDLNPNASTIGPFNLPFKPFKWEFDFPK
jgi:outer membrane protein OmpA-like peptidoglycan-associated protein